MPRSVGATRSEGGRSPGQRGCFLEGQERIVCALQKAKPAIRKGNQNPLGLELLSAAAERGNYPEAKPKRDGLKGRRACKQRRTLRFFRCDAYAALFRRQVSPASPQVRPTAKQNDRQRVRARRGFAKRRDNRIARRVGTGCVFIQVYSLRAASSGSRRIY
jgi:hypothetical protein